MQGSKLNIVQLVCSIAIGIMIGVGYLTVRKQVQPAVIVIQPAPTVTSPRPTGTPTPISVFVNGAVHQPGVYNLSIDSRVNDAIILAGGFSADAYRESVNLAQPLFDGAQVYVSTQQQSAEIQQTLVANPLQIQPAASRISTNPSSSTEISIVNLNSASRAELESIPGIGPATAQSIISYREDNGPFRAIEEVMNVSGIGEGKFDQMKDYISVE